MDAVTFKEKHTLGGGWSVEVRLVGALVGHIRRSPLDDRYLYYRGPDNILNASESDSDLEALKERIAERLKRGGGA